MQIEKKNYAKCRMNRGSAIDFNRQFAYVGPSNRKWSRLASNGSAKNQVLCRICFWKAELDDLSIYRYAVNIKYRHYVNFRLNVIDFVLIQHINQIIQLSCPQGTFYVNNFFFRCNEMPNTNIFRLELCMRLNLRLKFTKVS